MKTPVLAARIPEKRSRTWRQAQPVFLLALAGDARKIDAKVHKVEDQLEMQVWRPIAILRWRTDGRKLFAGVYPLPGLQAVENRHAQMPI